MIFNTLNLNRLSSRFLITTLLTCCCFRTLLTFYTTNSFSFLIRSNNEEDNNNKNSHNDFGKDVLPAIWYFKALNEEYDKNDALFDVVFNSGIICNTEPHTNNISSYISVSDDHYMTDNLLYFYWSISRNDSVDYIPYSSDYIRWKKKYFNICNYIEIPLRIAMIVIMKSMCKSSLIEDEKVIESFDKLDDDLLSKLVVDTALNSKKYDIDYFKVAFNTIINSFDENDFDNGRLEYEVSIIKARIYLAELLKKEGYEINDDTFEISRISTSESSGS